MKFIITNDQQDFITVFVSAANIKTQSVSDLLEAVYASNAILSKHIHFKDYQQRVQLSHQQVALAPNTLLSEAFKNLKRTPIIQTPRFK